jgi:hypothetical protein
MSRLFPDYPSQCASGILAVISEVEKAARERLRSKRTWISIRCRSIGLATEHRPDGRATA